MNPIKRIVDRFDLFSFIIAVASANGLYKLLTDMKFNSWIVFN